VAHYVIRVARSAALAALFVAAAGLGVLSGIFFAYAGDLPEITALDGYAPSTITRVYASHGEVIGEFATERRVVISYDDIAPVLRQAVVAGEDSGFERHVGVSISSIAVRLGQDIMEKIRDVLTRRASRPAGASTLTQQLARNLFARQIGYRSGDVSLERKVKEALVAVQIEKRYTKPEILALYCNQMYLGGGAYGVEAASRLYFGKHAKDLNLEQAALIAGIFQLPERQNPYVNMKWALQRRNYVLRRMAEDGYISQAEAEAARSKPIEVLPQGGASTSVAPYFLEEVRKDVERRFGAKQLYESGLAIYTSLDVQLQQAANAALDRGLRQLDKRRGFRKPSRNILSEGVSLDAFTDERWNRPIGPGDVVPAIVTSIGGRPMAAGPARRDTEVAEALGRRPLATGAARVRIGPLHADLGGNAVAWTGRRSAAALLHPGDVIEVRIVKVDDAAGWATAILDQEPQVDGALLAIDNRTGQIRAMVGGLSFARSKFNRATQAMRQMGSTFKPIVYTTAIDRGYTPVSVLLDTPVTFDPGPGQPPYSPRDYDGEYEGPITLRHALEQSRNVPAVRTLDQLGPEEVINSARQFGFQGPMKPFLSLALGSAQATLLEVAAAYSVFPNQGVLMRPYQILRVLDRDGNLVEENRPEGREVVRADTAYVMTSLLTGVIQRGTGSAAAELNWPLGGKTGTTDDCTDAWFTGFDPDLTVGVWVGLDDNKTLGPTETGAQAALPIWIDFMRAYIATRGADATPPVFEAPGNIVFLSVDRATGIAAPPDAPDSITEAFIAGTQPDTALLRR
jgi:penicillin-binding protein 1A